jgi:hypothetical protein
MVSQDDIVGRSRLLVMLRLILFLLRLDSASDDRQRCDTWRSTFSFESAFPRDSHTNNSEEGNENKAN